MRVYLRVLCLLPLPCLLPGQSWEVGASAGYGFPRDVKVANGSANGSAGFARGFAAGGLLGNQIHRRVGGEARYTFRDQDLRVKSGSREATMHAQSHAIHYDVLVHVAPRESAVRPFVAAGAGVKWYRGTGVEPAIQPLSNLVVLSRTNEAQPLVSVGGGIKAGVSRRAIVRVDFRDYLTPLPTNLLAAPPRSSIKGWMHDFVFLLGISSVF